MSQRRLPVLLLYFCWLALSLSAGATSAAAQAQHKHPAEQSSVDQSVRELQTQVRELQSALAAMRLELDGYRSELSKTRQELVSAGARTSYVASHAEATAILRYPPSAGLTNPENPSAHGNVQGVPGDQERLNKLDEDVQLLGAKLNEHYQTKVESASKYRVRLSGIALFNAFANRGAVDNLDFPSLANPPGRLDSGGTFGASVRQSQLGLEVFGPQFRGAKTAADVQMDFAGGFPSTADGVTFGLMRLRTATLRLDWPQTSVVSGQDGLFFSPLAPSSFATLAVPALSYAGNLWGWVPQIRVEHRVPLHQSSSLTLQAGILDALSGQPPATTFDRTPQPGERSRQPAYAARVAWSHLTGPREQEWMLGMAGYYSRQNWGFNRNVDAWSGLVDWSIPVIQRVTLSGEFYRGRAVGGLNGAFGRSVVASGSVTDPASFVQGLNSLGGWAQLKFKLNRELEFNGAAGQENPWARELRRFPLQQTDLYGFAARNQAALVNFIFRPRSDLIFSGEYRRLRTFGVGANNWTADHVNLTMGFLF